MAPRVALKEPERSPEREVLALAARKYRTLADENEREGKALASIETDLFEARGELAIAERHVEEAKQAASTHAIEAALGGDADEPVLSTKDARMAVVVIQDRIDTLNHAKTKLMLASGPLANQMQWALLELKAAVANVVATDPSVAALLDRLDTVASEHATLNAAVEFLSTQGMISAGRSRLAVVPQTSELEAKYRAAVARLAGDADALLPFITPGS